MNFILFCYLCFSALLSPTTALPGDFTDCDKSRIHLGCWGDKRTRAISGGIRFKSRDVDTCQEYAEEQGWSVFAVQYGGECFTSSEADTTYSTYGTKPSCCEGGLGGYFCQDVYRLDTCGTGETGDVGMKGDQGIQGMPGEDGPDGDNGYCDLISGACEGEPGDAGPPGDAGDIGEEGEAGLDGSDGADGADGAPGERGVIGPRGETGIKGESGDVGEDGNNAESNCDGSSRCKLGLGRCYGTSSSKPSVKCRVGFAATTVWKNTDFFGLRCCEVIKIPVEDEETDVAYQ